LTISGFVLSKDAFERAKSIACQLSRADPVSLERRGFMESREIQDRVKQVEDLMDKALKLCREADQILEPVFEDVKGKLVDDSYAGIQEAAIVGEITLSSEAENAARLGRNLAGAILHLHDRYAP
jgi:hypothetical protein